MPFDPTLAAIRFGMGLSPVVAAPGSVDEMLALLAGPDRAVDLAEIPVFSNVSPSPLDFRDASRAVNAARGTAAQPEAEAARDALREAAREAHGRFIAASFARAAHSEDGFRERLVQFWADHFTVRAVSGISRHMVTPYIEEAIRPHVAGRFGDMLVAVVGSPMMITYLDQHQSMGPNSQAARNRDRGLNENLAREVLELHTLGVGGAYAQGDVRQLAELLTGVTANADRGAFFRPQQAEPGPEVVLGKTYGAQGDTLEAVTEALHDLALHPDTARHLAGKLAVHFIGPLPDAALTEAMAARYLETGGDLLATCEVMLRTEAAWVPELRKVRQPFDFIAASLRALGVPLEVIRDASLQEVRQVLQRPLAIMGQSWQNPVGPDGWPEEESAWITPQGMAGRITWAMTMPGRLMRDLPDPREFVRTALGPTPPEAVVFAAGAAERVEDGIGVILASAAFQRR